MLVTAAPLVAPPQVPGIAPDLLRAVPRDTLLAVFLDFPPKSSADNAPPSLLGAASAFIQQLRTGGVLGAGAGVGVFADTLASLQILGDYPFAFVVTDIRTQPVGEDSFRLADLQATLLVRTGEANGPITSQIQALLTAHTGAETARIERTEAYATTVYTLKDDRLPAWATLRWAALGDFYVIALGESAFDTAARTIRGASPGLGSDALFQRQHHAVAGETAQVEWMLDAGGIDARLANITTGRVASVRAALGLEGVERAIWTIGRDGRAITAAAFYASPGGDRLLPIAMRVDPDDPLSRVIPPQATAYAAIAYPAQRFIRHVRDAYLAARRPQVGARLRAAWTDLESAKGFSTDADLFAHLGKRVVIHTFPPHPLGIPVFVTVLVEIDGSPQRVRRALDAILTQCGRWLVGEEDAEMDQAPRVFTPRLAHDDDGVWSIQAGITGPALTVVDKWIVLSFSPYAVRQNVAFIQSPSETVQDLRP